MTRVGNAQSSHRVLLSREDDGAVVTTHRLRVGDHGVLLLHAGGRDKIFSSEAQFREYYAAWRERINDRCQQQISALPITITFPMLTHRDIGRTQHLGACSRLALESLYSTSSKPRRPSSVTSIFLLTGSCLQRNLLLLVI